MQIIMLTLCDILLLDFLRGHWSCFRNNICQAARSIPCSASALISESETVPLVVSPLEFSHEQIPHAEYGIGLTDCISKSLIYHI